MPVKHRKLGRNKGDAALQALRDEMKKTLAVVQEEEQFAGQTAPGGLNTSAQADRFPALRNINSIR
jgi:hypothetical protein